MVNTSRQVNEEIEQADLMRRHGNATTSPAISQVQYKEGRASEGEYFVATDKFVAGVAGNIIASEAWQTLQRKIEKLEKEKASLKKQLKNKHKNNNRL